MAEERQPVCLMCGGAPLFTWHGDLFCWDCLPEEGQENFRSLATEGAEDTEEAGSGSGRVVLRVGDKIPEGVLSFDVVITEEDMRRAEASEAAASPENAGEILLAAAAEINAAPETVAPGEEICELVAAYLEGAGYEGLWCPMESCACALEDFMSCGE